MNKVYALLVLIVLLSIVMAHVFGGPQVREMIFIIILMGAVLIGSNFLLFVLGTLWIAHALEDVEFSEGAIVAIVLCIHIFATAMIFIDCMEV